MEPEQKAGSWQWGINNSLERVEGNSVSGQKVKSVRRLWSDKNCHARGHVIITFYHTPAEGAPKIPRDRNRVRGTILACPPGCPRQGLCQDWNQPSDTRAEWSTSFPEEPLPCCCQCRDNFTTSLLRQRTVDFILMLFLLWAFYLFTADACPCWD